MARKVTVALACALALAACRKDRDARPAAQPLAETAFYQLGLVPPSPCARGGECRVQLALTAIGGYHLNDRYPFKFLYAIDGVDQPADTGAFVRDGAHRGTLTIAFRAPAASQAAKVSGTFKLSVCTDENCEIAEPEVAFTVATR
jgi:hypothetical protein